MILGIWVCIETDDANSGSNQTLNDVYRIKQRLKPTAFWHFHGIALMFGAFVSWGVNVLLVGGFGFDHFPRYGWKSNIFETHHLVLAILCFFATKIQDMAPFLVTKWHRDMTLGLPKLPTMEVRRAWHWTLHLDLGFKTWPEWTPKFP